MFSARLFCWYLFALLAGGALASRAAVPAVLPLTAAQPVNPLRPWLTVLAVPPGEVAPSWDVVRAGALDAQFRPAAVVGPAVHGAYWVHARLRAAPPAAGIPPAVWVLETSGGDIGQAYEIYLVAPGRPAHHWRLPGADPATARDVPTRHYSLRLPLAPGVRTDLYLFTRHGGALAFTLHERQTLVRRVARADLFDGLYLGILLGLILYNLLLFFAIGDRGYLYYVAFTTFFGLVQVAGIGWWGVVFGGGLGVRSPWWANYALITAVLASALLAARAFLELPRRRPALDRWLRRALWLTPAPLVLVVVAPAWTLAQAIALPVVQMVVSLLILGATISQFRAGYRPARYLVVGWGLLVSAVVIYSLRELGLFPWNWLSTYGVRTASGIETILFSLGLADRINLARQERAAAQAAALAALQEKETAQTTANAALQARADELTRAYADLEASHQATDRLQSLDEAKTRFFTNVSHELRTPLTLILGPLDELRTGRLAPAPATFGLIHRQADHLLTLINQLLDVARLEAGELRLHRRPLDVGAWLRQHVSAFDSAATDQGLTLTIATPAAPVMAVADADQLEKIINNLVGNALKFTPSGGEISVELTVDGDAQQLAIGVTDTGPGISAAHLPHLFDRFYQADDSARRPHGGSGIGLALVKELTELHGGTVTVASVEGEGARFTVRLPGMEVHEGGEVQEVGDVKNVQEVGEVLTSPHHHIITSSTSSSTSSADAPLIVVIDDHADMRRYLTACLAPDYRVLTEPDGEAGLALLAQTIPDLVISDLMMPRLDGLEFARRLRADERTSHIPLILLTARADEASRLDALALGADDYLTKPFSAPELRTRVANLLAQRQHLRERYGRDLFLRPTNVAVTPADEVFLTRVLAVTEAHLAEADFDVEAFAAALNLSRIQLYRKLKAVTDQSPTDFLRAFRLQRAAELLAAAAGPVAEVAYAVGFNSLSYFAKCFREQYGYPPSAHQAHVAADRAVKIE